MSGEERQLYLVLAAIAAALGALIWSTGALAGLLFGSGWTAIGLGELLGVALRLPSHLGDPRAAWPAAARSALPGAVGIYFSTALIGVLLAALALAAHRFFDPGELLALGTGKRRAPSARWASRSDLAAAAGAGATAAPPDAGPQRAPPARRPGAPVGDHLRADREPQDHRPRDPRSARVARPGPGDLDQE